MGAGTPLSREDRESFARMHRIVLPGSLVAALGQRYIGAFYDYIEGSEREFALVRKMEGRLVAGCVVSLEPETLSKRLLRATPVLSSAALAAPRLPWLRLARGILAPKAVAPPQAPEILLIFATAETQGRGYGSELVAEAEQIVASAGHPVLRVKTLATPSNKALRFYERCGFEKWGEVNSLGKRLAVFTKATGGAAQ